MNTTLLISLLGEAIDNVDSDSGRALTRVLDMNGWEYELNEDNEEEIYRIRDDDGDTRWCEDHARYLWDTMRTGMRRAFEELVSKNKRTLVGKARLLPFPDKRSPTPAA